MDAASVVDPKQDGWRGAGRLRRFTFHGLAVVFAAVLGLDFLHHLFDLSSDGGVHHIHVAMHAVITGSLLLGIAIQLRSPARRVAPMQMAFVVSVVTATVGALTGGFPGLPFVVILVVGDVFSLSSSCRPLTSLLTVI